MAASLEEHDFYQAVIHGDVSFVKGVINAIQRRETVAATTGAATLSFFPYDRDNHVLFSALYMSCLHGHVEIAKFLIEAGIMTRSGFNADCTKGSLFLIAGHRRHRGIIELLLQKFGKDAFGGGSGHEFSARHTNEYAYINAIRYNVVAPHFGLG